MQKIKKLRHVGTNKHNRKKIKIKFDSFYTIYKIGMD